MTITLRLGFTESTLLYLFYMQTVRGDVQIHNINEMLSWFYKTSGYYDKMIRDISVHCIHSQNYIHYFETLINSVRNSTFTILLLHNHLCGNFNLCETEFRHFLHNKVFIYGIDDFMQHYVSPRYTSRHILVINPLSELMLEQYRSGNVYKAHSDFPPSVVDMMTYKHHLKHNTHYLNLY